MFPTDNFGSYADGYYGAHYNVNENSNDSIDNGNSNGTMYQVSQTFMDGIYSNNEVKALRFDPHEELLWCISSRGHMCAFYEYNLTKCVSIEVPELNRKPINNGDNDDDYELLDILIADNQADRLVYILGSQELLVYNKCGSFRDRIKLTADQCRCCSQYPYKSTSIVLGHQSAIIQLDLETKQQTAELKLPNYGTSALLRHNRGLLCATDDGQILTIDLRDKLSIQHAFKPHSEGLSDFTVNAEGYAVITCGMYRCNQQLYTDQFLKVYDLRYKKSQCPIKVEMQPSFVRFMPAFNDSILLASSTGQYQVANFGQNYLTHPSDVALLINEYDTIKAIDISSNSKLIAFGTGGGLISLASNCCDDLKINNCSIETTFPTIPSYMSMASVSYDDPQFIISSSEFVTEPLDKGKFTKLSSDWPAELCSKRYRKIKPVDLNLFSQYQSKFKCELIGRKPATWGPVWFPY